MARQVDGRREIVDLAGSLTRIRRERGLSQTELARRCGLSQAQVSYFEVGRRRPTIEQLLGLALALDCSIEGLLTGADRPGMDIQDLAMELRSLGLVDLWVKEPRIPGTFRAPEEILTLAISASVPDPRILETIPALMSWNPISPLMLKAHGLSRGTRVLQRLGWLADVALAIDRKGGFPGGCRKDQLVDFLSIAGVIDIDRTRWDDVGYAMSGVPPYPIWKRWRICYDADLETFAERARHLRDLGGTQRVEGGHRTAELTS